MAITAPEIIFFALRYPKEFAYEQSVQLNHLFESVEYWGRPWDYYLTTYFKDIFSVYLIWPFFAALGYGFSRLKKNPYLFISALWVSIFPIILSFGVSKISNFIYPALPVGAILIAACVREFYEKNYGGWIASVSLSAIFWYLILRFNLWSIKTNLTLTDLPGQRFLALNISLAIGLICGAFFYRLKSKKLLSGLIILSLAIVSATNIITNWKSSKTLPPTAQLQDQIKQTALTLNDTLPENSLIFTDVPELQHSNLYYLYWSKITALEVYKYHPVAYLIKHTPAERPTYLLSKKTIQNYPQLGLLPAGWLYKIR